MKKIFYFLIAALMLINFTANAQTVENNGVFSHMYIGINGGVNQTTVSDYSNWNNGFTDGLKSLTYNAGLELGKDVTPITGFSLQGIVSPIYHNVANNGSGEWKINRTDVFGNAKFNLMNLFGGYKGYPRRVEIRTVTGIGWNHNFDSDNPNDIALQAGLEFDFNLGKSRNWYITFQPMVQTNNILKSQEITYAVNNADLKANIGVAYRLGRYHNFKIVENQVSEEDYNVLFNKYNELLNKKPEVDTVIVEKVVEKVIEKVVEKPADCVISFEKGKSTISQSEMKTIESFAKIAKENDCKAKVIGSADSKTGSKEFNENIAFERAKNVAQELVKLGVPNSAIETTIDVNGANETSRCAIIIAE